METAPNKTRLLELLREAHAEVQALLDALPEDERRASGTLERWAFKDLMLHIGMWEWRQAMNLAAVARGEGASTFPNFLELNDQNFLQNRDRSWEDIWAEVQRNHEAVVAQLEAYTEEMLTDTEQYTWRPGQPIWMLVQGNVYSHTLGHVAQYYADRGDLEQGDRLQEAVAAKLSGPDASALQHGTARYNLACYYSTTGRHEKALALLAEAFSLRPDLLEYAKQDTDMDPLRERPDFQKLVREMGPAIEEAEPTEPTWTTASASPASSPFRT